MLEKDGHCKSIVKDVEVIPTWNLTCKNLKSLPQKNLYLRDYYVPSFTSSQAVYECAAGYAFDSGVSRNFLDIYLLHNFSWEYYEKFLLVNKHCFDLWLRWFVVSFI